jgi:hypothetical protein
MSGIYKYILGICTVTGSLTASAQSLKQSVIASGGGSSDKISGYHFDFTIGEPVIKTGSSSPVVTSSAMACTQGFQQPLIIKDFPAATFTLQGTPKSTYILLQWTTNGEIDNELFYVERSINGLDYTVIGQVATKASGGNSSADIQYQYTDLQPVNGNNYYRLRQVSKNNLINYSNTVLIPFSLPKWNIYAYPNPVKNIVHLKLYTSQKGEYVLRLVNMMGQVTIVQHITAELGYNDFTLNMSLLKTGMYVLFIYDHTYNDHQQTIKLIKE